MNEEEIIIFDPYGELKKYAEEIKRIVEDERGETDGVQS